MTDQIDAMLARLQGLERADASEADEIARSLQELIWVPNAGPQCDAFLSPADLLLYGGQGGGGKTDLLAGLALTEHKRSLLLRPQYTDLGALIDRVVKVAGTRKGLNSAPPAQFKYDDRVIDFGAAANLERAETWQGNPHDLIGFDEACQFIEPVIRFLLGWNRAAGDEIGVTSTQRVRAVMASNPPLSAEGQFIIGMFRPWLDPAHGNKAEHGELRWFIVDPDGKDMEVDGPEDIREFDGKAYIPQSRSFIPAALGDNPFLINTGYQSTLDAMPEPMRSAIRDGNFMAAREDDAWQVIPTAWVLAAQERWRKGKDDTAAMTAIGLDIARGGRDQTVLSPRYGKWFDELITVPGRLTPDGPSVVALVVQHQRDGASINMDAIGVGSSVQDHLKSANIEHVPLNGAAGSTRATLDGKFGFVTKRSEMWWSMREALDPDYGIDLALPPDQELQADLTTPTYTVRTGEPPKIYVESKEDIIKRLGRSPDKGDGAVYSWAAGAVEKKRSRRGGSRGLSPVADTGNYDPLTF